jgi:hypothetical protein
MIGKCFVHTENCAFSCVPCIKQIPPYPKQLSHRATKRSKFRICIVSRKSFADTNYRCLLLRNSGLVVWKFRIGREPERVGSCDTTQEVDTKCGVRLPTVTVSVSASVSSPFLDKPISLYVSPRRSYSHTNGLGWDETSISNTCESRCRSLVY